ncbi:MAG: hypothetical protein JXL80_15275 [Planctomycetes bacterium]|nr:hypothetical protein [Planctomycetota bacterium]
MGKLFLLRYDTEADNPETMAGFFEKTVEVHRREEIPATFFCRGGAMDAREDHFRQFYEEVRGDPLFDIQDHSYTHIGLCYERGRGIDELRADYERSFAVHERLFGVRPVGISLCGTSGRDGAPLPGFDSTDKARQEFEMVAGLGVRMLNTRLVGHQTKSEFVNYGSLGHGDIMGFPSGYSDTDWMYQRNHGDPDEYVASIIGEHASHGWHMPLMLHDWCAWTCADDKELTHVRRAADVARRLGYELRTHITCLNDTSLWK